MARDPKRAAAERRKARRPAFRPVIFGDPKIDLAVRQITGCGVPHQRLSALCSPHFSGNGKTDEGHPAPSPIRTMALGCLTIEDDDERRAKRAG